MFLILVVLLFKFNQWKRIFLLGIIFSIGFFIALFISTYFSIVGNIDVVKFVIPSLIFLLALFYLTSRKSLKYNNFLIIILSVFLFSFFNGLGVFRGLENEIERNTSEFLPILLTVFGASISFFCVITVLFVLKNLLLMIKKISETKWVYIFSFITGCISLFLVLGKVFV